MLSYMFSSLLEYKSIREFAWIKVEQVKRDNNLFKKPSHNKSITIFMIGKFYNKNSGQQYC